MHNTRRANITQPKTFQKTLVRLKSIRSRDFVQFTNFQFQKKKNLSLFNGAEAIVLQL